mgnify:CR=1 FL=1
MKSQRIHVERFPRINRPILIAGFAGWGNALDVSSGTVEYLISALDGELFATLNPDCFYRYDDNRPRVNIENGVLERIDPPCGEFYFARTGNPDNDVILFKGDEPQLAWYSFAEEVLRLLKNFSGDTVVTLGSMYDGVLHTERKISEIHSTPVFQEIFSRHQIQPINYNGPSAVHSVIHTAGAKMGCLCLSLWCHCPVYLQGMRHTGMIAALGALLAEIGGFELDVSLMEQNWGEMMAKIERAIDETPSLQSAIRKLGKSKSLKPGAGLLPSPGKKRGTVINLSDFLSPKAPPGDNDND